MIHLAQAGSRETDREVDTTQIRIRRYVEICLGRIGDGFGPGGARIGHHDV